jgi:hypothetical protein
MTVDRYPLSLWERGRVRDRPVPYASFAANPCLLNSSIPAFLINLMLKQHDD